MNKTVKVVLLGVYCAVFLHYLKYLMFNEVPDVVDIHYLIRSPGVLKRMIRDIKMRKNTTNFFSKEFKRPFRFNTDLKFILKWNDVFSHPSDEFKHGQSSFIENNCTYYNCFITNMQKFLWDPRYFDAIIFDAENEWYQRPTLRAQHQTYIFTAIEYSHDERTCIPYNYDNYFNLTWTYRLNSDIIRTTIEILDKNNGVIGPRINMSWIDPMTPTSVDVKSKLKHKKKAVAWFLVDCNTNGKTKTIAKSLRTLLTERNLTLDVYGWCGNMRCPKHRIEECLLLLRKDYYFYLSFEMKFREDYVTDEILHPLQNYAVPIVFGGADYTRFLPPGSYIDAVQVTVEEVVSLVDQAIRSPEIYQNYFRWHNHYTYRKAPKESGICTVCKILNEPTRNQSMVDFNRWWYGRKYSFCKKAPPLFINDIEAQKKINKEIWDQ